MYQKGNNIEMELVLALLGGENHLRGLSKALEEPPVTVSRRLKALVGENVLDYRTEGRNKVFFIRKGLQTKSYVLNAERYKLVKLVKAYPELGVIVEDVLRKCKVGMVILFGSYARFEARKDSDIDIYIETADRKAKEEAESAHSKVSAKIGEFDPESNLIREIIKNHVILRGAEEFYEKVKIFG